MNEPYVVVCPHCRNYVEILQENCKIFRHAQYMDGRPVNPHASEQELESHANSMYGCRKPFEIVNGEAIVCTYK
jgi:hypothetical protein